MNQNRLKHQKAIGVDLCFQGFDKELASLPCGYALPNGCLILAKATCLAGCGALRGIDDKSCEMKRLYVRPELRGRGFGRSIAQYLIDEATRKGYTIMRLDTLSTMTEAIARYESLGFVPAKPYRFNPVAGAIYMEKRL